ncbi:uncharacterized protein J3R85_008356 [Psidium guajava]|nr:uncharacterized protein J3R85_008356 [Psidium guajava]
MATKKALTENLENLETTLDHLWFRLCEITSVHIFALGCVLVIAPPSELQCSDLWIVVMLLLMVASAHSVDFIMLVRRLMQRYAELEDAKAQLAEGETRAGRRGRRSHVTCAILAGLFLVTSTCAFAGVSWCFACPERCDGH